jgi:PhoD-like phosphatase
MLVMPRGPRRREFLAGAAAAGASALVGERLALGAPGRVPLRLSFAGASAGEGWGAGWATTGVANLRRVSGEGLLEAGTDVFPSDPRPVAFAVDQRILDGGIHAVISRAGAGAGVVLRRRGPDRYYAAIYDSERQLLVILRRTGVSNAELAQATVLLPAFPITLGLRAVGSSPTGLFAVMTDAQGRRTSLTARDAERGLQGAGDPGVLATARTLFPSAGPPVLPALGNLHLLPYGIQEGQAVLATPVGRAVLDAIRERSTVAFREIEIAAAEVARPTAPAVVAATTGAPHAGGARLHVASDVAARMTIELSNSPRFERSRRVRAGVTGPFRASTVAVTGLRRGRRVYWRARLRRRGRETVGPVRSFRVLPGAGDPRTVRVAVGSCATQFGGAFDEIAARDPDVFIWQGDLNYPDTMGPLAQTMSGYAGIWREFLANPRMRPILGSGCFIAQRDDHDYGVQDANSTNLVPWGLAPWDALMSDRPYRRFSAGLLDVWVLDQRQFKTDPSAPDSPQKTLLGAAQRRWLLRTTAASRAPFKLICSPCTLEPTGEGNARDGGWANGFVAERDLILDHIANRVSGRTLFITGDTHFSMVYDSDGVFEARPCPLGIPTPNDITLSQPTAAADLRTLPGVTYADDARSHFGLVEVRGEGQSAILELSLVREDGETGYSKRFTQPIPRGSRRRR